ncbi:efflux RND transporter periplasmic adaptor subunit [Dyella tabacisoli]|uniref:Efflux RND transporter periplasmic adaptor subunit n=1 Tax=Dyella tabacisoli TaxID=2282381 RepID=A0A369UVT8_9GAMM|nr:efflux RND transporter periplasmic adaptor subunit [Dyella tabacisoli]
MPQSGVETGALLAYAPKLLLASIATLVLAGCQDGKAAADGAPPAAVSVATLLSKPVQEWDEFNGRVSAVDSVEVRPRISGYVQRVAFKEGDEVHKGDLLFVIDPRPYRAALDSATARLEHARATAVLAQTQDQRAKALFQAKATSSEEAETRQAEYAQSHADLRAAEAAVATAKLNVEFSEVRAPIDGRVSRAMLTAGNLAVADQTLLTSVVSQDPVYVYFDPDEQSYLHYQTQARQGQGRATSSPVRVGLANEQGFPHLGTVDFLDNKIDSATGTIHMRAVLANADHVFTPGMYAHVQLAGAGSANAFLIDDKAVLTDQDRKYVYVLGPGDKAMRKEVKLGRMSNGLRVIESGLSANDNVIIDGLQRIFYPGAPVKPTMVPMEVEVATAPAGGSGKTATVAK